MPEHSTSTLTAVPAFDPQAMITRFREQAQRDYTDYAMIGDAEADLVDGILTLRIDLRPPEARDDGASD